MGGIVTTRRPRMPKFNGRAVAAVIKAIVPGAILERTNRGVDANGNVVSTAYDQTAADVYGKDVTIIVPSGRQVCRQCKAQPVAVVHVSGIQDAGRRP